MYTPPETFSRVVFRIVGENQLRVFDPRALRLQQANLWEVESDKLGTLQKWCQDFVNLRCRPFMRLNGYNPVDRSSKSAEIIAMEVDHYFCDHPTVTIQK